jgi:large subunit ribosomal protein L3
MSSKKSHLEGLLGKKLGMTQVFTEDGQSVPVTAIELGPCYVLGIRKQEKDGYEAVQFGFEPKKAQRVTKALSGHFTKAGKGSFYHIKEIRCDAERLGWTDLGQEVKVADVFQDGEFVDVSGVSKGRGFAGVVKRFGVKGQPMTRGTHEVRRHIGALGGRREPGRVLPGQKMPGHMGAENVTIQNLRVVSVRAEDNVILVRGAVPGATGSLVVVKKAVKRQQSSQAA